MSPIVAVIQHYFPSWDPPRDTGREWIKALCPFHAESNPSATLSYENNAFMCFGCGRKGDVIKIIREQEGCSYREAVAIEASINGGSNQPVPQPVSRKSSRRVFGEQGLAPKEQARTSPKVPSRVRARPSPWA